MLEHVQRADHFFNEHSRVLINGGKGFHLFPLKNYIYEGHLRLPWVHRIKSWDAVYKYIRFLSRLGLGKFPRHAEVYGVSVDEYSRQHADYMYFWTYYRSEWEFLNEIRKSGLRGSFRLSSMFYAQKILSLMKLRPLMVYSTKERFFSGAKILKYISSITLSVEKRNDYQKLNVENTRSYTN